MPEAMFPNATGHYEGNGFTVDVNAVSIFVRTKATTAKSESHESRQAPQKKQDDENPSILSSLVKIRGALKK